MKIFVTGISGLLGMNIAWQLRDRFEMHGCYNRHPLAAPGIHTVRCDLGRPDALGSLVDTIRPDLVVNAAGLTSVDRCEADPALALTLNVETAAAAADAASRLGARLIHVSTDHLFDGTSSNYAEDARIAPLNTYGRTKAEAEQRVLAACPGALVVRTNFFGWGASHRESFSDWILRGLRESRTLPMFTDVFFTPILVNDLIDRMIELIECGASGVMNVGGANRLSKYDFGVQLARAFGHEQHYLDPVPLDRLKLLAPRPRDMSLNSAQAERVVGSSSPTVEDGLRRLVQLGREQWPRRLEKAMGDTLT